MRIVQRAGESIAYRDVGQGRVILLLHALTANSGSYKGCGIIDRLVAAGYRCIAPDALAHGRSSDPVSAARVTLGERVADVLAVLEDAGVSDKVTVAGYSMGAWIASGLLTARSDRVDRAALLAWDLANGAASFAVHRTDNDRIEEFRATMRGLEQQLYGGRALPAAREESQVAAYMRLFGERPAIDAIAAADVPILLGVGERDPYHGPLTALARTTGWPLITAPGDHVTAFLDERIWGEVINWLG